MSDNNFKYVLALGFLATITYSSPVMVDSLSSSLSNTTQAIFQPAAVTLAQVTVSPFGGSPSYVPPVTSPTYPTIGYPIAPTPIQPPTVMCPVGYVCTRIPPQPRGCPMGYICTPVRAAHQSISIISPNGGETIIAGQPYTIRWSTSDSVPSNAIVLPEIVEYNKNGNLIGSSLINNLADSIPNSGSYIWNNTADFLNPYGYVFRMRLTLETNNGIVLAIATSSSSFTIVNTSPVAITASLDPISPLASIVQISPKAVTPNIPLAVFDLKSSGSASTLKTLRIDFTATADIGTPLSSFFSRVSIKVGGQTYTASSVSPANAGKYALLDNLSVGLPADVSVPVTVFVDTNPSASSALNGMNINAILKANSTSSIQVMDANNNFVPTTGGNIYGNTITFTSSQVQVSNASVVYGPMNTYGGSATTSQQFTFNFGITAGNDPIYIQKGIVSIFSTQGTASVGFSTYPVSFSSNNPIVAGDTSTYYYIAPGQTRMFSSIYQAVAVGPGMSGTLQVNSINYGTSPTALSANVLNVTSTVQNNLKAVLFH